MTKVPYIPEYSNDATLLPFGRFYKDLGCQQVLQNSSLTIPYKVPQVTGPLQVLQKRKGLSRLHVSAVQGTEPQAPPGTRLRCTLMWRRAPTPHSYARGHGARGMARQVWRLLGRDLREGEKVCFHVLQ